MTATGITVGTTVAMKDMMTMMSKDAYWIQRTHVFRRDEYVCSACGCIEEKPSAYCPRCGAKMKKTKYTASWVDEMEAADIFFND